MLDICPPAGAVWMARLRRPALVSTPPPPRPALPGLTRSVAGPGPASSVDHSTAMAADTVTAAELKEAGIENHNQRWTYFKVQNNYYQSSNLVIVFEINVVINLVFA